METIIKKSIELTKKYDKLLIQKRKIQDEELKIQVETFRILQEIKKLCVHNDGIYKEAKYDDDYYEGTSIICNICHNEIDVIIEE